MSDPATRLRAMLRIRRLEETAARLYTEEKIRGFLHLYIGEEAVAAGVTEALGADAAVVATYREHGHALLRGVGADRILAEMYGRVEGCSRGRGGSMHLFDTGHRVYGGNAIVGGGLPLALGLALSDVLLSRRRVTACFFGEGAAAEGEFHESMNLAALWRLPVLFVCENNLYAMGTALSLSESVTDIGKKAAAYGMPAEAVDGMDVALVAAAAARAVAAIRETGGPYFLEARTYRFRAHSMFDPELYRTKEEVERWKARDPITTFVDREKAAGTLDQVTVDDIETEVRSEIEQAVAFAEAGTLEPIEDLLRDVQAPEAPA